mgnify:FL=1
MCIEELVNKEDAEFWERIPCANLDERVLVGIRKATVSYLKRDIQYITVTAPEQGLTFVDEYRDGKRHVKVIDPGLPSTVEVKYRNGTCHAWSTTHIDVVHCKMWGIPLSFDCRYIFAPQKNGSLCCLSVEDGSVQWKTKSRAQFKQILVNPTGTLRCAASERDIVVLDSATGEEQLRKRITWINDFYVLEKDRILVEANARQWHILNSETLEVTEVILKKNLDTNWMPTIWERLFRERHPSEDEEPITP